jgi:hypothetical protein
LNRTKPAGPGEPALGSEGDPHVGASRFIAVLNRQIERCIYEVNRWSFRDKLAPESPLDYPALQTTRQKRRPEPALLSLQGNSAVRSPPIPLALLRNIIGDVTGFRGTRKEIPA